MDNVEGASKRVFTTGLCARLSVFGCGCLGTEPCHHAIMPGGGLRIFFVRLLKWEAILVGAAHRKPRFGDDLCAPLNV